MPITATQLRADVYKLIDQVLETGIPLEIERGGKILRLCPPPEEVHWLDRLIPRDDVIIGDPEDLVHIDWSVYWNPDDNL